MKNIAVKKIMEDYINQEDWRVKENSTVSYSIGGSVLNNAEAITSRYWLTELYDKDISDAHKDAYMHIHDLGWYGGYCSGWSLGDLIKKGLVGVNGRTASAPPKHLSTLTNIMVNFIGIMANEFAGAQAYSSVDTYLAPFVKVDNLSYKEVKQSIQSFVFGLNFPNRWGSQAPFSNISLDWTVPEDLAELNAVVGGVEQNFCYKDCKKEMNMINKAFIEVMLEGDAQGRGHQYPIPTYSITNSFDWDENLENNKLLFEMTAKYGTPYFSNYVNSDMNPSDVRSMCPLDSSEKVLIQDERNGEFIPYNIKDLYTNSERDGKTTRKTISNGKIIDVKINKFKINDYAEIELVNGLKIKTTMNHLNKTLRGDEIPTSKLTEEDYLPISNKILYGNGLTYDEGLLVGAFLGDGSFSGDRYITYSLNKDKKLDLYNKIIKTAKDKFGAYVNTYDSKSKLSGKYSCSNISISSKYLTGLIKDFVNGETALEKSPKLKALNMSVEFRQGIIDGVYQTDGGNSNRIYSASKNMIDNLTTIFASLGQPVRIDIDDRKKIDNTLSDNPVYCLRFYSKNGRGLKDVYVKDESFYWFKIKSITKYTKNNGSAYCLEVVGDSEPYFMMPNGIHTHNCRLRLDLRELEKKNGGYFGAGENTGSIGVVTLNLSRFAYESKTKEDFFNTLEKYLNIAKRSLVIKREVLNKEFKNGLYPYAKEYLKDFSNHFSTIGIISGNEMCLNANWIRDDIKSEVGHSFTVEVLKYIKNKLSDFQEETGELFNLEATPAESTTFRFAKHDKEKHKNIITAGQEGETPYYTNSTHLPVGYTEDIFDALDLQDEFQVEYTSGTVFHGFLGESVDDWKLIMKLVKGISDNYKLPYYTISPTYSICNEHGYLNGEHQICPVCGKHTEVYSRITGYYRAINNWNDGKKQEFHDRKEYKIK